MSVPERELAKWVSRKKSLAVFREIESSFAAGNSDLMPASVMKMMLEAGFDRETIEGRAKQPVISYIAAESAWSTCALGRWTSSGSVND